MQCQGGTQNEKQNICGSYYSPYYCSFLRLQKKPSGDITGLSFKSTSSIDYLRSLNGKPVTINGYLATSSPADGSFIFLMNLPYQNCPFCVPNTSQLVNTLEVYPKKGQTFGYTTQAVSVTGTLEFSDEGLFTDAYGYEFEYRLVDAEYYILNDSELSKQMQTYNRIADSGIINDLYSMYDYLYFTCAWPEYFCNSYTDADGSFVPGYYLWSSDVEPLLESQYSYVTDSYFDDLIIRIGELDADGSFAVMADNVKKAKALADEALLEVTKEAYTYEYGYVEKFETEDYVYTLNRGPELMQAHDILYFEFCDWINSYEL